MQDWKKNIKPSVRMKIWFRDQVFQKLVYNPIQAYRRRHGLADKDLFKHAIIQTNYLCTRKCKFCHYGLERPPENVVMEEGMFYSIIDQMKALGYRGRTGLFEINEPLTDKRLVTFIRYTRQTLPDEWIFISSNGDLLNRQKAIELFGAGLDYIFLSAYDNKALKRNLCLLRELPQSIGRRIHHLNRTYQTSWSNRGGNISQFKIGQTLKAPCDFVYEILYVKPNGKIYSCYNDFHGLNEMGDLNRDSLEDIWFGPKFMALRKQLNEKNREANPLCRRCDHIGYAALPKIPAGRRLKQMLKGIEKR